MSLWNVIQHFQIQEVREEAKQASLRATGQGTRVATTNDQIERLILATQAMWELLRDHANLTDDQLREKMKEIDCRDGTLDDKIGAETLDCPHCSRKTHARNGTCMYCGEPVERSHVFEQ